MSLWYLLLALYALPATLFAFQSHPAEWPENLLREALTQYQKGDVEVAIEDYKAYLEVRPDAFEAPRRFTELSFFSATLFLRPPPAL